MDEKGAFEDKFELVIRSSSDRRKAHDAIDLCTVPSTLRITPPKASDELTSRMHCAIRCVAKQVQWQDEWLTEEEWKLMFVSQLYGQKVVPSISGKGWTVIQKQTKGMSGAQKYDLTELVYAFGTEHNVEFDD